MSEQPVRWGDARATHHLILADGREVAARRFGGPDPAAEASRVAGVMVRLAAAGLPVPSPTIIETAPDAWIVTPWVDGPIGADWLDTPGRARHLAERMGRLARQLAGLDTTGLGLAAGPMTIERAWLDALPLESIARDAVEGAVDRLGQARPGTLTFAHRDLAPINVVLDTDGDVVALLDLEGAGADRPYADVAWWGWVVRHHHPAAWLAAWPTFRAAAGVPPTVPDADLGAIALLGLLRRAASADDAETERRWLDRVSEAARWSVVPPDQAT